MWIHHLFSFWATLLSYFFNAIGTTVLGWFLDVAFLGAVTFLSAKALHTKKGWQAVVDHWNKEKKVAIRYALWCSLIIYGPLAILKLGQAVYDDHHGLVVSAHSLHEKLVSEQSGLSNTISQCRSDLESTRGTLRDKEALADSLQAGLASLQGPQAQQAANIGSCITNLAKMNPQIRQQFGVVFINLATMGRNSAMNPSRNDIIAYIAELIVITNVAQPNFHGSLRCSQPFDITVLPLIHQSGHGTVSFPVQPNKISPSEYEIGTQSSNTEWNPSHPVYLQISSKAPSPEPCSFTPMQ